jgi:large subunit ribosomal protein L4
MKTTVKKPRVKKEKQEKKEKTGSQGQAIFGLRVNPDLVHQVVVSQMANRRQGTAHTKDRSEVSGGGRKPWRQKGTGRARHGSNRSPLWEGGGITFGPRNERVYTKTIPAKIRKQALLMALSAKEQAKLLLVVDNFTLESPKTKQAAAFLEKLSVQEGSVLFVVKDKNEQFYRAARNLAGVAVMEARNLNALDVMSYKYLVAEREAVKVIEKCFKNEK